MDWTKWIESIETLEIEQHDADRNLFPESKPTAQ